MSNKLRRYQDEIAAKLTEIEEIRSLETTDTAELAALEERLNAAIARADELGAAVKVEQELNAKVAALRTAVVDDSEARSKVEKKEIAPVNVRHFESGDAAMTAGRYLRALARGEVRALGETSPTYDNLGAELVPAELYGSVINVMNRVSVAARVAFVVNTISKKITLPKLGDATASFYSEAAQGSLTDIATSGVDVTLFGLRSLCAVSNDLLEDSVIDVASIVSQAYGNAFASKIDAAWLQGDQTAGIAGLVGEIPQGNFVLVGSETATTVEKLAEMVGKVDPLAGNTSWVVSSKGMAALLAAHAGTQSVMMSDAMAPTVFGRPVYVTNGLPVGTLALYGDFSMSTAVAVKPSGLRIDALRELRAINDQVVFAGKQRIGIANHAPEYVAALVID
jgi:hypothetical protein